MSFAAGSQAEINVTPMIDVLLVLIIIFMVVVPSMPHGLESAVPQGKASAPIVEVPPVVVELLGNAADPTAAVRYRINQREVAATDLASTLHSMLIVRQNPTLFVQADRSLSFAHVADVVSAAKLAGATTVSLETSAQRD